LKSVDMAVRSGRCSRGLNWGIETITPNLTPAVSSRSLRQKEVGMRFPLVPLVVVPFVPPHTETRLLGESI
jgi:hypothetical protein